MIRRYLALALVPAALVVPAAALAATGSSGSGSDPKGDTESYGDLVRASATYKSGGTLKAKFTMADVADAAAHRTVVGAFFAKRRNGKCDTSSGTALSFESDTKVAEAGLIPRRGVAPKVVPAKGTVKGNAISLSVSGSRFAGQRYNCVVVATLVATGPTSSKALDRINLRLKG